MTASILGFPSTSYNAALSTISSALILISFPYTFADEVKFVPFPKYKLKVGDSFLCQSNSLVSVDYNGDLTKYNQESFGFKIISDDEIDFSNSYPLNLFDQTTFPIVEMTDRRLEFGMGATYGGQFDGTKTFWFRAQSLLTTRLLLLSANCERL